MMRKQPSCLVWMRLLIALASPRGACSFYSFTRSNFLHSFSSSFLRAERENYSTTRKEQVQSLLQQTLRRSRQTLSDITQEGSSNQDARHTATDIIDALIENTTSNGRKTTQTRQLSTTTLSSSSSSSSSSNKALPNYKQNPTVTTTALAHSLWKQVLRPGIDSAIDATAGNGYDATVLAQILFGDHNISKQEQQQQQEHQQSQLICIDIQESACQATLSRLQAHVAPEVLERRVQVLQKSHATLLPMNDNNDKDFQMPHSIGLVVYNLGFLPRSGKTAITTTETTLQSLQDAACLVRPDGGLLSVMTYPKTNPVEHAAVLDFLEGLALFSSNTVDWRTASPQANALERVWQSNGNQQKWRVHKVEKLGWVDAPVLITAARIQ